MSSPAMMRGEAHDRAHGEVDAAGQDDEGHADGEDRVEGRLLDEDLDVGAGQEGALDEREEDDQDDEGDEGTAPQQELGRLGPGHAAGPGGLGAGCHWFTSVVAAPCCRWRGPRSSRSVPHGRCIHELLLGRPVTLELGHHGALREHQDAIGHGHHLLELRGDEEDRVALAGEAVHDLEDLRLGAHVDAPRRLVEQQHPGGGQEALGHHDLLLVAAGQRADVGARGWRPGPRGRRSSASTAVRSWLRDRKKRLR